MPEEPQTQRVRHKTRSKRPTPECWFVRLRTLSVHRSTERRESDYAQDRVLQATERIPVRDTELDVSAFLPRTAGDSDP